MRIAFCVHPKLEDANKQRAICTDWLAEQGIESITVDSSELLIDSEKLVKLSGDNDDIALVCALGGDGTILRSARLAYAAEAPLLGVNFGNLGFLSGASSGALFSALEAFLAHKLHEEKRVMLQAEISFSDSNCVTHYALNELFVGRSDMGKVIVVDISVNGNQLPSPRGDGVIVATASGSTAYAHAAGGPLLTPDNQGLCIVPVSSLGFNAAALVSAPSDVITLAPRLDSEQHPLLFVDGQLLQTNGTGRQVSSVVVTKAQRDLVILRYDAPDFYSRISHSLAGGSHAH